MQKKIGVIKGEILYHHLKVSRSNTLYVTSALHIRWERTLSNNFQITIIKSHIVPDNMVLYLKKIYRIDPKANKSISRSIPGDFFNQYRAKKFVNIGRTKMVVVVNCSSRFNFSQHITKYELESGETKMLDCTEEDYHITEFVFYNSTEISGIMYQCQLSKDCTHDGSDDEAIINIDYNRIMKELVSFGVKFVPTVGPFLSVLVKAFWPENKPNVWLQIKDKVQGLIDSSVLETVNGILSGDIRQFHERIELLQSKLDSTDEDAKKNAAAYYMNLAQDMVGFELKFTYPENKKTAFALLPMYTAVVMLKMNYYAIGICKAQEIGIAVQDVRDIKKFASKMIEDDDGVVKHINAMYKERVEYMYNTCDVRDLYNVLMNTRSYIGVNGLEYIPLWRDMLQNPCATRHVYVDTVTYSEFYGKATPNLYRQATPEVLTQPLTPKIINGKRNKLKGVELYLGYFSSSENSGRIRGMQLYFENGDTYKMGWYYTSDSRYLDFKGAYLEKVHVTGDNSVDSLTFYLSDGRVEKFGKACQNGTVFELKGHYIASIFLSSDSVELQDYAANIAVSYVKI